MITKINGYDVTHIDTETGEVLSDKIQGQNRVKEFLSDESNLQVLQRIEALIDKEVHTVSD